MKTLLEILVNIASIILSALLTISFFIALIFLVSPSRFYLHKWDNYWNKEEACWTSPFTGDNKIK